MIFFNFLYNIEGRWRIRLGVRTPGFQSGNTGSTPVCATKTLFFIPRFGALDFFDSIGLMTSKDYLRVSRASDLSSSGEQKIYRGLEMLPGILAWTTLILIFVLSWQKPVWVAVFVIFFDLFWLLRILYRSLLLRAGYQKMKEYEKIDWKEKLDHLDLSNSPLSVKHWKDVYHLVIFPMYQESLPIVRESFLSLINSDYPQDKMIVVLGCEKRAKSQTLHTAQAIKKEFGDKFFRFMITWHPSGLPGEIAGKGSNETWAARKAKKKIIDPLKISYQKILISSFDADTVVFPKYFSCLTYHYLTAPKPTRTSFQPIPLFVNNIWKVPVLSRIFSFSCTFWNTMNQAIPENLITFSSHSMSFETLVKVGFRAPNVVNDDSRIFWQCFLKFDGDYRTQPLYYPVSMDAVAAKSYSKTLVNLYRQQRRWAYGVGEIPFALFGFLKNKKISLKKKLYFGLKLIEGHWSWATTSYLIFFLGWLPFLLGGPQFNQTLLSYNLPLVLRNILSVAMIGLISSAYFSILLLPPKPPEYGRAKYLLFALEWMIVPIVMLVFTPTPALEAQTRWMLGKYLGFWPMPKTRE